MHPESDAHTHTHAHIRTWHLIYQSAAPFRLSINSNYISPDIYSHIRYDLSSSLLLIIALIIDRLVIHHEKREYGPMTAD